MSLPAELLARAEELAAIHAMSFVRPKPWSVAAFKVILESERSVLSYRQEGFALGRVVADEAELLTLAVCPAARRQGRGRLLLQGFLAEAIRRGAHACFLEVAADNAPAIALYAGAGFSEMSRRRGYYDGGGTATDALVMTRVMRAAEDSEPQLLGRIAESG